MRTPLGPLLALVLLLGGCGGDTADPAADPADGSAADGTAAPSDAAPRLLALVSQSDVGGEVAPEAVPLGTLEQTFTDGRMTAAIRGTLGTVDLPEGTVAAGAVVAVGCEEPRQETVEVEVTDAGVEVTAPPVGTDRQCLVPVTTVALVAVPRDLV